MRTLAVAVRQLDQRPEDPLEMEEHLTFVGMIGLRERVRPEVRSAVSRAAQAGVRTVMVTGDHATTAAAVADAVGLQGGAVMEGHELSGMTVEALTETIGDYRVFARVDPADKVKIIRAWQAAGAKVAMTGDGVNDAPALHRADIGVAMGSGTDVAREAAAIVLTDDNYATIVAAIAEGRRLFSNLRNVVHYLLSANASEVFYVLVGFLFFGFLGEPLLAVQLLWINLISDSLPAIALGMDRPSRDPMLDRPGRGRDVLSRRNLTILLAQGVILAAAALLAMAAGAFVLDLDHSSVQTMAFTTLVISQLLHALSIRAGGMSRSARNASRPGRLMVGSLLGSILLHLGVVYSGPGNTFFHTVPLAGLALVWSVALSILSMIGVRALKRAVSV
jgi:Ca2+-transporting ATPase